MTRNDPTYVEWLKEQSMLGQTNRLFEELLVDGRSTVKLGANSMPDSERSIRRASTWVSFYPDALITRKDEQVIHTLKEIIEAGYLQKIGIRAVFTTPITRSGSVAGKDEWLPSTDGGFDPISMDIDPKYGTNDEYRDLIATANKQDVRIIGNLVPLHTGQGPDFLLALLGLPEYRAIYMMSEIDQRDWWLLKGKDQAMPWASSNPVPSRPLTRQEADRLYEEKYIPGRIRSADSSPDASELTGWSVTDVIEGFDGKPRRWVYLHFFKPSQPVLNLDYPDCQALRMLNAAAIRQIREFGVTGLRLDAIAFSVEEQAWASITRDVYTPSAIRKTDAFASLIRAMDGFTFQELMAPLSQIKESMEHGTDLTYDFFTRAPSLHAALTGDATLLRMVFRLLLDIGIDTASLVHDLQNHDELTYQLPELLWRGDDRFEWDGERLRGSDLQQRILKEMHEKINPTYWNRLYRPEQDGIATTVAGFLAAGLEINPYRNGSNEVERIRRAHLLVARVNAMQPGVFCLSAWDLVGALPLQCDNQVPEDLRNGDDFRWYNRGGVDVTGMNPDATDSASGLNRAKVLYGPLPEQLQDEHSFASRLQRMLAARERYAIAYGTLWALPPEPGREQKGLCILGIELPGAPRKDKDTPGAPPDELKGTPRYAITALNFSHDQPVEYALNLAELFNDKRARNYAVIDAEDETAMPVDSFDQRGRYLIRLGPLEGKTLVLMQHL